MPGENVHSGEKLFPAEGEQEKSRIFLCHSCENASSELWDVQPALTGFIPAGHVKASVWACPGAWPHHILSNDWLGWFLSTGLSSRPLTNMVVIWGGHCWPPCGKMQEYKDKNVVFSKDI